jgi:hypothetical protein
MQCRAYRVKTVKEKKKGHQSISICPFISKNKRAAACGSHAEIGQSGMSGKKKPKARKMKS